MAGNRIRELRKARGLSGARLGEMIGRTKHQISRLENGETKLDLATANAVATALGVGLEEVLGIVIGRNGATPGFSDNAVPYDAKPDDALARLKGEHRYLYTIDSDALEGIGIKRGDAVVVDDSDAAVKGVRPLQGVLVNYHPKSSNGRSILLPRQFVPPALVITNGSSNLPSITLGEDAHIFAVIVLHPRVLS